MGGESYRVQAYFPACRILGYAAAKGRRCYNSLTEKLMTKARAKEMDLRVAVICVFYTSAVEKSEMSW
jgi:hypothetical protein